MAYSLLEAYRELKEDITSIKRLRDMYSKIDNETFTTLLKIDPTYNNDETQSGDYANWILNRYSKNLIKDNEFEKITKALDFFTKNKNRFTNKDLNSYQNLQQLQDAINEVENKEISKSKLKRNVKKTNLDKDAPLFMETENFNIYIPLTYEASCKLGTNTRWCTATRERDNFYKQYTENGNKLYVMVNKKNPKVKYQWNTAHDYTCNANDVEISTKAMIFKYPDLFDFYTKVDAGNIPDAEDLENLSGKYKEFCDKVSQNINNGVLEYTRELSKMAQDDLTDVAMEIDDVEKIIIKSDVRYIPNNAFKGWQSLKEVVFENGVESIGNMAFYGTNITNIELPLSLDMMGESVFDECDELKIIILNSVIRQEENIEEPQGYNSRAVIINTNLYDDYEEYIEDNYADDDSYCEYDYEEERGYIKDNALEWYFYMLFGTESFFVSSENAVRHSYKIDENDLQRIQTNVLWYRKLTDLVYRTSYPSTSGIEYKYIKFVKTWGDMLQYQLPPLSNDTVKYSIGIIGRGDIQFGCPIRKIRTFKTLDDFKKAWDEESIRDILNRIKLQAQDYIAHKDVLKLKMPNFPDFIDVQINIIKNLLKELNL